MHMVDGWNAWYFKDALNLSRVWPGIGANRCDVLDLWLGFLRYYYDGFDDKASNGFPIVFFSFRDATFIVSFQNLVVCIRQRAPLTKFEKMWNSPCIAIEDPFDLSHNLGAGISRKSE